MVLALLNRRPLCITSTWNHIASIIIKVILGYQAERKPGAGRAQVSVAACRPEPSVAATVRLRASPSGLTSHDRSRNSLTCQASSFPFSSSHDFSTWQEILYNLNIARASSCASSEHGRLVHESTVCARYSRWQHDWS